MLHATKLTKKQSFLFFYSKQISTSAQLVTIVVMSTPVAGTETMVICAHVDEALLVTGTPLVQTLMSATSLLTDLLRTRVY